MSNQNIHSEILNHLEKARQLVQFLDNPTDEIDAYNIIFFAQKDYVERFDQPEPEPKPFY